MSSFSWLQTSRRQRAFARSVQRGFRAMQCVLSDDFSNESLRKLSVERLEKRFGVENVVVVNEEAWIRRQIPGVAGYTQYESTFGDFWSFQYTNLSTGRQSLTHPAEEAAKEALHAKLSQLASNGVNSEEEEEQVSLVNKPAQNSVYLEDINIDDLRWGKIPDSIQRCRGFPNHCGNTCCEAARLITTYTKKYMRASNFKGAQIFANKREEFRWCMERRKEELNEAKAKAAKRAAAEEARKRNLEERSQRALRIEVARQERAERNRLEAEAHKRRRAELTGFTLSLQVSKVKKKKCLMFLKYFLDKIAESLNGTKLKYSRFSRHY